MIRVWWIMLIVCAGLARPGLAQQTTKTTVSEVARELVCDCPDCGKQALDQCATCSVGQRYRAEIAAQLKQGRSKEQIINAFAEKYGDKLLGNPRPKGANRMAALVPLLAVIFGLVPLGLVLRARGNRSAKVVAGAPPSGTPASPPVAPQNDAQLEAELRRFDY